jgi:hypothetical protein
LLYFIRQIIKIYKNTKNKYKVETLKCCIDAATSFPLFALSVLRLYLIGENPNQNLVLKINTNFLFLFFSFPFGFWPTATVVA